MCSSMCQSRDKNNVHCEWITVANNNARPLERLVAGKQSTAVIYYTHVILLSYTSPSGRFLRLLAKALHKTTTST